MQTYIPYHLRVQLKQIDPILDKHWQQQLDSILSKTPQALHQKIEDQYLKAKNISWNYLNQTFEFKGHISLKELQLNTQNSELLQLAHRINTTFSYLQSYQTDFQIADYLETIVREINQIDLDNPKDIQAQQLIKKAFLYDTALIIRELNFSVSENHRHLNIEQVRTFIFEVFMKSEILGSWFAHILPSEYADQELTIFQDYFISEQQVRDFEIIKTFQYYFVLSSSYDSLISAYSIRRFLTEESFGKEDRFYISGLVLDPQQLNQPNYFENFKQLMTRIIGIQSQMNPHIVELVESLHEYNHQRLIPSLKEILNIQSFSIEHLVKEHLEILEKDLSLNILEPFLKGLKNSVQHTDELEFCYLNILRLINEFLHQLEILSQEPILQFNPHARLFKYRLIAYLKLLEQRRAQIFVLFHDEFHYQQHVQAVSAPTQEIRELLNDAIEQTRQIQQHIRQLEREMQNKQNASFIKRLFKKPENHEIKINELKQNIIDVRDRCYLRIIALQKQTTQASVYLEAKNLIPVVDSKMRHYAFANGENGVTRLPLLLQLPEERNSFNMQSMLLALNYEFMLSAKAWGISQKT
ncbi:MULTISPECIES: hypothetical protein [Acinetobacter]|jgi:hypothetical protein|uniref:Uncharacterized protein n=1 Tax=Acinetobacter schindleri TaxID=108981 RepID=A0AAE6WXY3_9GAMM|nr:MULTISPECIES: hypothetical protein [Acinetobacter]QIC67934.1 hypothetical protein FSC10_11450 [Acinetobacter schindleri]UOH74359.1 hypothetical protein MOW08_11600 [Acinetobacter schindleri]